MAFSNAKLFREFETHVDMTKYNPLKIGLEEFLNKNGWTLGEYADVMQEIQDALIVLEKTNIATKTHRNSMNKTFATRWMSCLKKINKKKKR